MCIRDSVEEVSTVTRPGEAVVHVAQFVVERCLSGQGTHAHLVAFVAFEVGAHDDPLVVGTDGEDADGQEVVALRLEVLVQDDLLALEGDEGIDRRRREVVAEYWHATADRIAEALAGALVVPPALSTNRNRDVSLFDAVLYLLVHLVLE